MKYLIVFILCTFAISKMSIQGDFGKKHVKNTADALCFNGLIFLFSALIFSYAIVDCPWQVWIFGTFSAVFSVIYQVTYTKALAIGNVSLTVLIVNLALVINVLVSYLFYGDSISELRFVGILLTIITFFLCVDFKDTKSAKSRNWIVFVITAMFSSAAATIVQKILGESSFAGYNRAFTTSTYIVSAILTYIIYRILKARGEEKTFKIGKKAILYALLIGVILATYVVINVYALSIMEATFLFPTYSGGNIILSALTGVILFKDKLNLRQILSIVIGIVAVVLVNF